MQWHVLHRARRRTRRHGHQYGPGAAGAIRQTILVSLEFLDWLDLHGLALDSLTQRHIDMWLTSGTGSRPYFARDLVRWAITKKLAPATLTVPALKVAVPKDFTDLGDYTQQLHRCLHDRSIPIDVRAGGTLILLFGLRMSHVLALRADQLLHRTGSHYLRLGDHELLLPPLLAELLGQLPRERFNQSVLPPVSDGSSPLMFPGFDRRWPIGRGVYGDRLKQHGITPHTSRNTAMITLAAELPAAVLADLLGLHPGTAVRWVRTAKRDWHIYLAERRATTNH
ncbi:hypothetical protein [Nocardia sp. SYP-A9097]|uniref:hypothetical protein n=1 Tax=Nocardia sp. SYP-A9097 TaxID=2663237 RepID=UPI001E4E5E71|nr:hypothetical protein [Nocardia sp. SYP-A9097]